MSKLSLVSMGSDPEVFIKKNGLLHMAVGVFPGEKKKAYPLSPTTSILEDNVLLEFNVAPSFSRDEFIEKHLESIYLVRKYAGSLGFDIHITPCESFPMDDLQRYPQAMEFGCDPDHDAWSRRINKPGNPITELRSAGAHIHFGLDGYNRHDIFLFARLFEVLYMRFMLENEIFSMRRTLYGKASSIRLKPYGFEYRTPSNFWIEDPRLISKTWEIAQFAIDRYNDGIRVDKHDMEDIKFAINEHVTKIAKVIAEKYSTVSVKELV